MSEIGTLMVSTDDFPKLPILRQDVLSALRKGKEVTLNRPEVARLLSEKYRVRSWKRQKDSYREYLSSCKALGDAMQSAFDGYMEFSRNFSRIGVAFSSKQVNIIRAMQERGDVVEAQREILKTFREFGA